jgi:hypothetical protein
MGLSPELKSAIDQFITENKIVVFIKVGSRGCCRQRAPQRQRHAPQ